MIKENKLAPDGKLSQLINITDYSHGVISDIRSHMLNLRDIYTRHEIDKILDLDVTITPPKWFFNLDILSIYPFLKELPLAFDACKQVAPNFPIGITRINEMIRELIIILPDKPNIRAAFPFLVTAYIIKDRRDMRESTSNLIYQLLESREKTGIDKFLKRFVIEPWYQKLSKAKIKSISYNKKPMLRSYYVCALFAALICQASLKSNPYLSAALFEQQGGYARLLLPPVAYKKLKLNKKEVFLNDDLNKITVSEFGRFLHQIDKSCNESNLEPSVFFLRAKIDYAIRKKEGIEGLEDSLTEFESISYSHYIREYITYDVDKDVLEWD